MFEWRKEKTLHGWCSLGIQYITSVLKKQGFEVYSSVFERERIEKIILDIKQKKPQLVGFVLYQENLREMLQLAKEVKIFNSEIKVITGGHTATLYPIKILTECKDIDIVVCGEGEKIYIELCKNLYGNLKDCCGIAYRNKGMIYRNPPEELIENLDLLPMPDYQITKNMNNDRNPFVFTSISTSRGCLGNCTFCVEHRVSRKNNRIVAWRGRSPENIIEEIAHLQKKAGNKKLLVNFVDGSIEDPDPKEKKRLNSIITLLEKKNIKMAFSFLTRADSWTGKDKELIQRMKKIGLFCVSIGFESGSPKALHIFEKRSCFEDNIRAYDLFKECSIGVNGFIIMFHPYADLEMLRETADTIRRCHLGHKMESWTHSIYIYPDTKIFYKTVCDGLILGTDPTGYSYQYAYVDGRVKLVEKTLEAITDNSFIRKYDIILESINRAVQLYQVWKEQDEIYAKVEGTMSLFMENTDKIICKTEDFYYNQFLKILVLAEEGRLKKEDRSRVELPVRRFELT